MAQCLEKSIEETYDPPAVFNVLDAVLVAAMERLKNLTALCTEGKVGAAQQLHDELVLGSTVPDLHTYKVLMNWLCKMGELSAATWPLRLVEDDGVSPDCVTYNTYTLIDGCCHWDGVDKALNLVSSIVGSGVKPNVVTCNTLVRYLCNKGFLVNAKACLTEILSEHEAANVITWTALMDGCFKKGDILERLRSGLRS